MRCGRRALKARRRLARRRGTAPVAKSMQCTVDCESAIETRFDLPRDCCLEQTSVRKHSDARTRMFMRATPSMMQRANRAAVRFLIRSNPDSRQGECRAKRIPRVHCQRLGSRVWRTRRHTHTHTHTPRRQYALGRPAPPPGHTADTSVTAGTHFAIVRQTPGFLFTQEGRRKYAPVCFS